MAKYLLIESRDPFDSSDSQYIPELVQGISDRELIRSFSLCRTESSRCEGDRNTAKRCRDL